MGPRPGETQNQHGWRPAFQGQRLLHHGLPQRRLQTGREKRFHSARPRPAAKANPPKAKPRLPRPSPRPRPAKNEIGVASLPREIVAFGQRCNVSTPDCFLRRGFSAVRPRADFISGTEFGAQCFRPVHRHRGAIPAGGITAGGQAGNRHQHRFCPAGTRAAGRFRRAHQGIAGARTQP